MWKNFSPTSFLLLLLAILCYANLMDCGKVWHFKIAGKVQCYDPEKTTKNPSPDAKIELLDMDTWFNDHIGETKTNWAGEFVVTGEQSDSNDYVEPFLHLFACGTEARICLYSEIEAQQNVTILMGDKIYTIATTNGHDSIIPMVGAPPLDQPPYTVIKWKFCNENGFWKE